MTLSGHQHSAAPAAAHLSTTAPICLVKPVCSLPVCCSQGGAASSGAYMSLSSQDTKCAGSIPLSSACVLCSRLEQHQARLWGLTEQLSTLLALITSGT